MNGNIFARLTGTKRNLLALLASSAMLTAGCANMANTAPSVGSLAVSATLGGKVHGGNQPVSGATVTLYYAAQSLYAAPILAATTTTSSDGTGSFNFVQNATPDQPPSGNTFSCPSVGDPLVYVVAKGGNTLNNGDSSVHNAAAAFMGVFGPCSQIATAGFLNLTEATTVATMAAYQQFFDPSNDGLSADGIGQAKIAIVNAANTVARLVDTAHGTALASSTISAGSSGTIGVSGVQVTATPETAKLNTLANAISACVNNASASATPCNTLFASAVPPSPSVVNKPGGTTFAPATDVLQAAYYILSNPTNGGSANLGNIFGLSAASGAPYQPSLSAAPTDWTIAINYSSTSTCTSSSGNFIFKPYDINIDDQNNIWIANSQAANGNLSQLSSSGAPLSCIFLSGGSNGGGVIDSNGNVWLATTASNNIYRYSPGGSAPRLPQGILAFPTGTATPLAVTADGLGNVYFTGSSDSSLYQIPSAATATAIVPPIQISQVLGPNPIRLMPDYNGNTTPSDIWVSTGFGYVARVSPSSSPSDTNYLNGFSTTTFTIGSQSYGLAVTNNNQVFASSGGADNYLVLLAGSGTTYLPSWTTPPGFAGINNPTGIAIDGRNNVWVPNNTNTSATIGSISEISAVSNALSPTTGFQKSTSILSSGRASAVDQAGNVWVVGDGPSYLTEIVGAGVPIYQPYAAGLANGRFQTIP